MKKALSYLIIILFFTAIREPELKLGYDIDIPESTSSLGSEEDPIARINYERKMLANPKTGNLPANLSKKEHLFAKNIPSKSNHPSLARRTENEVYRSGPYNVGGRTRAVAFDVLDEKILVSGGVSGSIWKTKNGGQSWYRTSDPGFRNSVTALAQDTRAGKENIWYYGTGELVGNSARSASSPYRGSGLFKSTDSAESWVQLASTIDSAEPDNFTSQFQYIWNIEVNDQNITQDEVLVAAYGGILRSVDGGKTWNVVLGQDLTGLSDTTDLNNSTAPFYTFLEKTENGNFYAALSTTSSSGETAKSAGIYFSTNGYDWQNITPSGFMPDHNRTVISASQDESVVYFFTSYTNPESGAEFNYLWLFEPNGESNNNISGNWQNLTNNLNQLSGSGGVGALNTQSGYNMAIAIHPENNDVVFLGATNLYRSNSGFKNTSASKWIGGYDTDASNAIYPNHYPDQHLILFYPSDPDKMITANDGGLRVTNNNRADSVVYAKPLNNGYITSQFYSIAQRKDEESAEIIGGMQDNGTYLNTEYGEDISWFRILGGDGGYSAISHNNDFIYTSFQYSQIYRIILNTDNTLRAYARVDPLMDGSPNNENYLFINPYLLDPVNPNRMFILVGNQLWRNDNLLQIPGGSQEKTNVGWSKITDSELPAGIYTCLEKSSNSDDLYAGFFGETPQVIKVENASQPQTEEISKYTSPLFPEGGFISCIAVNPEDAEEILVIFSNYNVPSVFHSLDGGQSFTDISGNLEEGIDGTGYGPSIRWGEIIPTTDGTSYYLGTSIGLVSTENLSGNSTTWYREAEETIGSSVIMMMDYRDIDGRLVVATHGNGVFEVYIGNHKTIESEIEIGESLEQINSYPNPFSDQVNINFSIPEDGEVKVDIYDKEGRLITNILWGPLYAGENFARWNGTNTSGVPVKSGLYFARIQFNDQVKTSKIYFIP